MTDEAKTRTKGGKPRKYASEAKRPTLTFRVRGGLYEKLKEGAEQHERSISEEIERRLEQSYDNDLLRGIGGRIDVAIRKVTARIIRVARQMPDTMRGTALDHELNTRREWQAAIDVIKHAYAPTEVERPEDPSPTLSVRPWGLGDHGRFYAYNWLEFEGDDPDALNEAKSTSIEDVWTGVDGRVLGDLVEAGLLTREQGDKRLFSDYESRPIEEVLAREIRLETSEERAAGWESMLNRNRRNSNSSDQTGDPSAEKTKGTRKAKPLA